MSFLDALIKDPKYQDNAPRQPEEISDADVIISPDTRRDNRIPSGQSRTRKWPVLDAHGTPSVDLGGPRQVSIRPAEGVPSTRR